MGFSEIMGRFWDFMGPRCHMGLFGPNHFKRKVRILFLLERERAVKNLEIIYYFCSKILNSSVLLVTLVDLTLIKGKKKN